MNEARRFNEQEIAAIFRQASAAQEEAHRHLARSEGLTLAELQQIGQEAGITPAFIAHAAASVDQTAPRLPSPTYLGLPIGVTRTIELPGPFTDADWDRLVIDLRDTFQATGTVRRDGALRQWNNGNLHALVEPTETGHRLHLSTRKGNAPSALLSGLAFSAMGLFLLLVVALAGDFKADLADALIAGLFGLIGLATIGFTAYRLPRWVKHRGEQMEAITARTAQGATSRQEEALPTPNATPFLNLDVTADVQDVKPSRNPTRTRS